jgi:hypothetical protein
MSTIFLIPSKTLTLGYFTFAFQLGKNLKLINPNHGFQPVLKLPALTKENYFYGIDTVMILDINPIIRSTVGF